METVPADGFWTFSTEVIELPIRDGNNLNILLINLSNSVIELPIRDGNVLFCSFPPPPFASY